MSGTRAGEGIMRSHQHACCVQVVNRYAHVGIANAGQFDLLGNKLHR
jgi:hypothetical protein